MIPMPPKRRRSSIIAMVSATLFAGVLLVLVVAAFVPGISTLGAILWGGTIYGSDWLYPVYVHRFRITIKLNVDGQEYSGTSVNEIISKPAPQVLTGLGHLGAPGIIGEALCIDLGKRGALVLTLDDRGASDGLWKTPKSILSIPIKQLDVSHPFPGNEQTVDRVAIAPTDLWSMVLFTDPSDKNTIKPVDPGNLQSVFGDGAKIISVNIESTNEKLTRGLGTCIPWILRHDAIPSQVFTPAVGPRPATSYLYFQGVDP